MSYSTCIVCDKTVSLYEKLCAQCEVFFGKEEQDKQYWRKSNSIYWEDEKARLMEMIPALHLTIENPSKETMEALRDLIQKARDYARVKEVQQKK